MVRPKYAFPISSQVMMIMLVMDHTLSKKSIILEYFIFNCELLNIRPYHFLSSEFLEPNTLNVQKTILDELTLCRI